MKHYRTLALLPLVAMLIGCEKTPGVYDLPIATVFERLSQHDMKDFRTARQCGLLIHFAQEVVPNKSVRWIVNSSGAQVASFTLKLTALDAGRTQVTVDIPTAPDGGEIYDGTKTYKRPALHQPLRPAIAELVDARLEQRPFDVWRIPEAVRVTDDICSVQRAGLESGSVRFRYDSQDEVGLAGRDTLSRPTAAPGQPMLDPRPSR